jgi:hypothetical protein
MSAPVTLRSRLPGILQVGLLLCAALAALARFQG